MREINIKEVAQNCKTKYLGEFRSRGFDMIEVYADHMFIGKSNRFKRPADGFKIVANADKLMVIEIRYDTTTNEQHEGGTMIFNNLHNWLKTLNKKDSK